MSETDKRLEVSLHTASGNFSEVVAISQRAINNNLDALLKIYPEFGDIEIKAHDGTMNAKLASGRVALHIVDNNRGMVDYFCTFKSGEVSVWDDDLDDFTSPIPMTGWVFAFAVNMAKATVEEGTDEHKQAAASIDQPGNYSISRLYLDFNSNQIASFNEEESSFGDYKFSDSGLISFKAIMLKWAAGAAAEVENEPRKATIGYAAHTDDPNSINAAAPTFPPTSFRFQNYEYIGPGQSKPTDGPGAKGDNNVLLYLEMTQNLSLPTDILSHSGNFVTKDMDGTICISKEVFLESYLLRDTGPLLLNTLNRNTHAWIKPNRNIHSGDRISDPQQYLIVGPVSPNDKDLSFFSFTPVQGSNTKYKWTNSESTEDSPRYIKLELWTSNANTLEILPGTNKIALSGETMIHFKNQEWYNLWAEGCESKVKATWNIDLTLNSVKEGGVEISLNLPDKPTDIFHVGKPSWDEWPFDNLWPPYGDKMKSNLVADLTKTPLLDVAKELEKNLASASRFVVPGGGTFFYKDPIFNSNGDVLIEAKYNGVDVDG